MPGFGGEVKLTGEEAYRRSLTAITEALKENGQALKSVADQYAKSDKSTTAVTSAQKELQSLLEKQKNTLDQARQAYGQYAATLEEQKVKHQALTKEYKDALKELENIRKTSGETSDAYKAQAEKVEKLKQEVAESNAEYAQSKATLKEYKTAMNEAEKAVKDTEAQLDALDKGMEETDDSTKRAGESARNAAQGGFTVLKGVIADLASKVIQKAIEGFKNLAKSVYDTGVEFDSAMSKVGAISGATAQDLEKLTEKAEEMGRTTKFRASESAEAFNYMAMAGWKTEEMLDGIEGILNLAAASGADLATTSDIVTDALTGMGYAAKDAGRLADVMAAAAANANTTVELMGVTFQYTTPIAGSLGYTMEDVALAIGLMANSGIKGERAGTALRSIMQRLASDTGKARTTLEELGVTVINQDGTMRNFRDVLADSRKALNGLTDAQKTSVAKTVAGAQAMAGFLAIINATDENFEQLAVSIDNSTGAADRMAKTMLNNVGGKMTLLKSQLESIQITIWKKLEPTVRKCIDTISQTLKNIDWEKAGRRAAQAFEKVTNVFVWLIDNWKVVVAGITAIINAFVAAKIATFATSMISAVTAITSAVAGATSLSGAFAALNTVMMANPIGLVVGALAGLATILVAVANNAKNAMEESVALSEAAQDQVDAVNNATESWQGLKDAQKEQLDANMSQLAHTESLRNELQSLVDANGRVKEGYEGRVKFILGELNSALGTEYSMTDGIVNKYQEMVKSIDDLIEKKRAQIILNSQEALYTEAINSMTSAMRNRADLEKQINERAEGRKEIVQRLNEAEQLYTESFGLLGGWRINKVEEELKAYDEETAKVKDAYSQQTELLKEYTFNIDQYESNAAALHEGRFQDMTQVNFDYVKGYESSVSQQQAILQAQIDDSQAKYDFYNDMVKQEGEERWGTLRDQAQKELDLNKSKLDEYNRVTANELMNNEKTWIENAAIVLSKLSDKKIEFKKTGDNQVQMYVDGVAQGKPMATQKAEEITRQVLADFDKKAEAEGAGKNVITGFTNGEGNLSLQNTAFATARNFATSILDTLKKKLGIASPSKETKKMGAFLVEGLGIGIDDEENSVLKQAQNFGKSIVDAMSDGLNTGVDTTALTAVRDAIPEDINGNVRIATATSAAVAEAESPLVGAFKQALSEMKIELDSEVAGEFVDRKVTKLVYNL